MSVMTSSPTAPGYLASVSHHPSGVLPRTAPRRVPALLRACHPEPALAVTLFVTALAVTAGRGRGFGGGGRGGAGRSAVGGVEQRRGGRAARHGVRTPGQTRGGGSAAGPGGGRGGLDGPGAVCAVVAAQRGGRGAGASDGCGSGLVLQPAAQAFGAVAAALRRGLRVPAGVRHPRTAVARLARLVGRGGGGAAGVGHTWRTSCRTSRTIWRRGCGGCCSGWGRTACRWLAPLVMLSAVWVVVAGPPGAAGRGGCSWPSWPGPWPWRVRRWRRDGTAGGRSGRRWWWPAWRCPACCCTVRTWPDPGHHDPRLTPRPRVPGPRPALHVPTRRATRPWPALHAPLRHARGEFRRRGSRAEHAQDGAFGNALRRGVARGRRVPEAGQPGRRGPRPA